MQILLNSKKKNVIFRATRRAFSVLVEFSKILQQQFPEEAFIITKW